MIWLVWVAFAVGLVTGVFVTWSIASSRRSAGKMIDITRPLGGRVTISGMSPDEAARVLAAINVAMPVQEKR